MKKQMDKGIKIFVTGGTFDKEYDMITQQLAFKDTHLREIFELSRCTLNFNILTLMMIDSLQMTDKHREIIRLNCELSEEKQIVITHGTDTMANTAAVLASAKLNKTIVLTGAMIPYKFGASDAFFNLGNALAFVQVLPDGVYIAMNGRFFMWDNVQKNQSSGLFEEVNKGKENPLVGAKST